MILAETEKLHFLIFLPIPSLSETNCCCGQNDCPRRFILWVWEKVLWVWEKVLYFVGVGKSFPWGNHGWFCRMFKCKRQTWRKSWSPTAQSFQFLNMVWHQHLKKCVDILNIPQKKLKTGFCYSWSVQLRPECFSTWRQLFAVQPQLTLAALKIKFANGTRVNYRLFANLFSRRSTA